MKKKYNCIFLFRFFYHRKIIFCIVKKSLQKGLQFRFKGSIIQTRSTEKNVIETVCLADETIYTTCIVNCLVQRGIAEKIPIGTVA